MVRTSAVYERIKALIVEGRFAMGERLGEDRLSELVGASRTPIREALARLETEGFVVYSRNRGHRVVTYTAQDVYDIYACRALLESEAARLVAQAGLSDADAQELTALVDRMDECLRDRLERPAVRRRFLMLNHQFHGRLYGAVSNLHLQHMIGRMTDIPSVIRNYFNFSDSQLQESQAAHRGILRAILNRDPDRAAALMREHIWAARDRMLVSGEPADPPLSSRPNGRSRSRSRSSQDREAFHDKDHVEA
jgi:DNA-binding GntR family transcriptional regulator